jgi:RNA polymerase sigma factor (sigma-70 family)
VAALRRPELSEALGENYAATFARLKSLFRSRGVPGDEAADLAQETAARLLVFVERHGGIVEDPFPLIHRIATNLLIDRARSSQRHVVALDPAEHDRPSAANVEDEIARRQRRRVVRREIKELSGRQRDAIVLSLDGHTPSEIADRMGLERNAADALLFRARKTLANRLTAVKEELNGLGAIALLRIRSFARRGTQAQGAGQYAAAVPAFVHAFTAALVLAIGGMAAVPAVADVAARPPAIAAVGPIAAAPVAKAAQPRRAVQTAPARKLSVDARDHRVHFQRDVRGPAGTVPVSVDVWQERDGVHRGVAGPAFDAATDRACKAKRLGYVCAPGEAR